MYQTLWFQRRFNLGATYLLSVKIIVYSIIILCCLWINEYSIQTQKLLEDGILSFNLCWSSLKVYYICKLVNAAHIYTLSCVVRFYSRASGLVYVVFVSFIRWQYICVDNLKTNVAVTGFRCCNFTVI